jgi:nucleoside-diphosphate kinase
VLALAVSGESAISVVRTMMGATNPLDSAPGTIRGDLALELSENIVHGSDSKPSARRELALFFPDGFV